MLCPPFEGMEPVTRHIHIVYDSGSIQGSELQSNSSRMLGLDARLISCLEIASQAFVLKRLDHGHSIARCASRNNH